MPGIEAQDFESTRTVVMDALDVLRPRVVHDAIAWPLDDDTAGPACLPYELDEDDLVALSWMERFDARLETLPPFVAWAILYAMLGACALCAALIIILLCLPAL